MRESKSVDKQDNKPLSIPYLKCLSNKFDVETIFVLNISNQSLSGLGSIGECTNLMFLDITQNKIKDLTPISKLMKLQVIKMGKNFISAVDPLKDNMKMLHMDLHGNGIKGAKSFACCKNMTNLSSIYLQTLDGQYKNPICSEDGYRASLFETVPQLKRLDGVGKNKKFSFDGDVKQVGKLEFKADPSSVCWYTKEYPRIEPVSKVNPTLDDQAIQKSLSSCQDIIKNIEKQLSQLKAK